MQVESKLLSQPISRRVDLTSQATIDWLASLNKQATNIFHGIEKEGLRTNAQGQIAQTDHPLGLGSALSHETITTDYAEALTEFITPVISDNEELLDYLSQLHHYTYQHIGDETIWPGSMPNVLPNELAIRIAQYGSSNIGQLKHVYRHGLWHRYGRIMQTIAGLHFNFSFDEEFWPEYQKFKKDTGPLDEFISRQYFHLIRGFRRNSWLLIYLFGASPACDKSFIQNMDYPLETLSEDTYYLPYATSLRMSDIGYTNNAQSELHVCYNSLSGYTSTLLNAINTPYPQYKELGIKKDGEYLQLNSNILQIENEYYSDIRPKRVAKSGEKPLHALAQAGVEYIEVRCLDLNPLMPVGIDATQVKFIDSFMFWCLLEDQDHIEDDECNDISNNLMAVVKEGRKPGLILNKNCKPIELKVWAEQLLNNIKQVAENLDQHHPGHVDSVNAQMKKVQDPTLTPSALVLENIMENKGSYKKAMHKLSKEYKQTFTKQPLDPNIQKHFDNLSADSIVKTKDLEAQPQIDFDQFVDDFLTKNLV